MEQITYTNHLGELYTFGQSGIFVSGDDLRDFKWDTVTKGDRITEFSRGVTTHKLPVTIICSEATEEKNRLYELTEKDVLAVKPGRLTFGGYYLNCYISESKKSDYHVTPNLLKSELTVVTDYPSWVKETTFSFALSGGSGSGGYLDFSFDYPIDYTNTTNSQRFVSSFFAPANFRLIIYGAVTDPEITIGGHIYKVNATIAAGEYLTIDSRAKTIVKTGSTGVQTNLFNSRNRAAYIFEKIPSGTNLVSWNNTFGFDVIILEERSEPKWI